MSIFFFPASIFFFSASNVIFFFRLERNFFFRLERPSPGTTTVQWSHHSIIPLWIYRIPSELRSQARLGPISTAVGDHAGILGVECFFFFGPFLTMFWSKTWTWRPIVNIPLVFLAAFFPLFSVFFAFFLVFFLTKTVCIHV